MEIFIPDFDRLGSCGLDRLERELRFELQDQMSVEKMTYAVRQAMIQEELLERGPMRTIDGLGQHLGEIDARTFFRWDREEPGCWNDRNWVRKYVKDNPEAAAPRPEMKTTVLV